jgi:acyl-CoA thioesterase
MDIIEKIKSQFESEDLFPKSLGIELLEISLGFARVAMTIGPNMVNFHNIGHGGVIFSLADTALGLASNSYGIPAVAITSTIDYLAPAQLGERLVATAEEKHRSRRTGNYLIHVVAGDGRQVSLVRGIAYFKSSPPGEK